MKLEVGMYVIVDTYGRYGIGQIKDIVPGARDEQIEVQFKYSYCSICRKDITKASHNIIDLIEAGDYVNSYKVIGFDETYFNGTDRRKEPKRIEVIIDNGKFEFENHIKKEDIKTILTKGQIEHYTYKIGDD